MAGTRRPLQGLPFCILWCVAANYKKNRDEREEMIPLEQNRTAKCSNMAGRFAYLVLF